MGNTANSRFRQTEHLLRHYNYYKAKIEEKKAEIAYLRRYGLPEISPNFVGANVQGNTNRADMLDEEILRLEKLIDLITYSDPVSLPETKKIETDIMKFISGINPNTLSKQNISRIKDMLERRNHLLKNIK